MWRRKPASAITAAWPPRALPPPTSAASPGASWRSSHEHLDPRRRCDGPRGGLAPPTTRRVGGSVGGWRFGRRVDEDAALGGRPFRNWTPGGALAEGHGRGPLLQ